MHETGILQRKEINILAVLRGQTDVGDTKV